MNLRIIRNNLRLISAYALIGLYLPHLIIYFSKKIIKKEVDLDCIKTGTDQLVLKGWKALLYLLHNDRYFRSLFYYRIGPVRAALISWIRPGERTFIISVTSVIGEGMRINHPYSTVLNAEKIGRNFSCRHLTTLGNKSDENPGRPIIGDNVTLGANVTVIGPIKIGNNVIIGAGSVVVKDVPDNVVIGGNPARIIKSIIYE